jgi:hypothetical protein
VVADEAGEFPWSEPEKKKDKDSMTTPIKQIPEAKQLKPPRKNNRSMPFILPEKRFGRKQEKKIPTFRLNGYFFSGVFAMGSGENRKCCF